MQGDLRSLRSEKGCINVKYVNAYFITGQGEDSEIWSAEVVTWETWYLCLSLLKEVTKVTSWRVCGQRNWGNSGYTVSWCTVNRRLRVWRTWKLNTMGHWGDFPETSSGTHSICGASEWLRSLRRNHEYWGMSCYDYHERGYLLQLIFSIDEIDLSRNNIQDYDIDKVQIYDGSAYTPIW